MRFKMAALLAMVAPGFGGPAEAAAPQVGDVAPGFTLPGSDGQEYSLDDFRDKRVVILAWFPKAFTGG